MPQLEDGVQKAKAWWKSKTIIGTIMMILPVIIKIIKPDLAVDLDLEAGVDAVFTQAGSIATEADALWYTLSQSIGVILTAVGIRTAKTTLK